MSRPLATVAPLRIEKGRRVLCMSDVHAMPGLFQGALKAADYDPGRDTLILLGDLVEKGPDSLDFLRYLMDFRKGKDVRFLRGNCDQILLDVVAGSWPAEHQWRYLTTQPQGLIWQMARAIGFELHGPEDFPALRVALHTAFAPEIDFVRGWGVILADENVVFVHGGIPDDADLTRFDLHRVMKNDNFLTQESHLKRWCVVGHTPVTLYHEHIPCADPMVDRDKHVIAIDGGCGIKPDGQLNCVIFPAWGEETMEFVAYDGLPQVAALDPQEPSSAARNVHWGANEVAVEERGEEFSRCRQLATGYTLDILNDFLYTDRGGVLRTQDSTDYRLPVSPGDRLKVVRETGRGLLAKKGGVTGWYGGRYR